MEDDAVSFWGRAKMVMLLAAVCAVPPARGGDEAAAPRIIGGVCKGEWSPPAPPPPMHGMVILESMEFVIPTQGRSIIVEKAEPPPRPSVVSVPPAPVPSPEQIAAARARWAEAARRYREGRNRMLMLSCTVWDHRATLVGWNHQGRQYRAWSNIDFNHIAGIRGFESADGSTSYSLWMGIGNQKTWTRLGPTGRIIPPPEIPVLPADGPGFVVIQGDATDTAALADMEALHALYRAEGARLKAACEERERNRLERAAWLKANPPQPHDTVVRHWRLTPEEAARIRSEAP